MAERDNKESQQAKPGFENEGEGNKTAGRHYNEATQKYVESGKVDQAAEEAREALEGPEAEELRRAEEEGKRHAADRPDAKRVDEQGIKKAS